MAVGNAEVAHRPAVALGQSTIVRLSIKAASELSALKTEPTAKRSTEDPGFIYKLAPGIDLYPWMWAELQAAPSHFQVSPTGRQRKPIVAGRPAEWVWTLTPIQGRDRQDLVIRLGTLVSQLGGQAELELETAESISFAILIQEMPTTPAKTAPTPAMSSTAQSENVITILIVIVVIVGGVLMLSLTLMRQGRTNGRQ